MEWTEGHIPRFHPLIVEHNDIAAWYICDGHADTEHSLAVPCIGEPCVSHEEAEELAAILNEENEDSTHRS